MTRQLRGTAPEIRRLLLQVRALGGEVELSGGGHWRVSDPAGGRGLVFLSFTPSARGPRSTANARRDLRHAGWDIR